MFTTLVPAFCRSRRRGLAAALATATLAACGGGSDGPAADEPLSHAVGRTSIEWTDATRAERCGGVPPGTARRLQAYVWYPATPAAGTPASPLLSPAQAALASQLQGIDPAVLAALPSASHDEAPLDGRRASYPVLLMSQGNASVSPLLYASTAEALARRGYVVLGLSHPHHTQATFYADGSITFGDPACELNGVPPALDFDSSFADRQANLQAARELDAYLSQDFGSALRQLDALNAADARFRGRLQVAKVGAFGHSFGGSHAFRSLRDEPRIAAAANIDGTVFDAGAAAGVAKPYLTIVSRDGITSADQRALGLQLLQDTGLTADEAATVLGWQLSTQRAFEASSPAWLLTVPAAAHNNFTDEGLWDAYGVPADAEEINVPDARPILELQNQLLGDFFDHQLRGRTAPLVLPATPLPGVTLETRP